MTRRKRSIALLAAACFWASWGLVACGPGDSAPATKIEGPPGSPSEGVAATPSPAPPAMGSIRMDPAARPTKLVLITLDTARADALGAYGQALPSSPEIDRLAREGVVFEQAIASNPETLPSHATLFTGRFPFAHGVRSNSGYVLPEESTTLAELLRDVGFATAAEISALVMNEGTRIAQGFEQVRDPDSSGVVLKRVRYGDGLEREIPTRVASDISRRGIEFIRANQRRPFFLWLHYFDPHVPYSAPGRFNARIPSSPYHAEVASADAEIGRVIEAIERLGLRDETLVVLTSDHGEGLGDHGELTHSYFTYQSTMRIPLVFWGPPNLAAGTRVDSVVRNADIAPTVLELLGHPIPTAMQGQSLRALLEGEQREIDLLGYGESIELAKTFAVAPLRFVVRGKWKYVHKVKPALYDLEADPGELDDVAAAHPEIVAELAAELEQLLREGRSAGGAAHTAVDEQTRARLEALGYVVGESEQALEGDIDDLAVSGIDAAEMVGDVETLGKIHALLGREDYARALPLLEAVRERHPQSGHLLAMHARLLVDLDREAEAVPLFGEVLERNPKDLEARQRLAHLLHAAGKVDRAIELLGAVFELEQCSDTVWSSLNDWLAKAGRFAERSETLGRAVAQCPDAAALHNNLAWSLATSPDPAARDGARAVAMAQRALELRGAREPALLDTLAAAHAEAGDYAEAVRIETRVVTALEAAGVPAAGIAPFRAALERFRARQPVRDPAASAPSTPAPNG